MHFLLFVLCCPSESVALSALWPATSAWQLRSLGAAENETTLFTIMRKDQPEFLARAIKDSGTSKDSLGRILVHATHGGRVYRRHRCCRLLGEVGAEVRCEDAVKVTGGNVEEGACYRRLGWSDTGQYVKVDF